MEPTTTKRSGRRKRVGVFAGIAVVAILCVTLFILLQPKPSAAVESYLTQIQEGNYEEGVTFLEDGKADGMEDEDEQLREFMESLLTGLTYELGEETVDGNKATVTATIENVDVRPIFAEVIQEMMVTALADAFSENPMSEDEMSKKMFTQLNEEIKKEGNKRVSTTVKVSMIKLDGEWKIAKGNEEFFNALSGGMNDVGEAFDELSTE